MAGVVGRSDPTLLQKTVNFSNPRTDWCWSAASPGTQIYWIEQSTNEHVHITASDKPLLPGMARQSTQPSPENRPIEMKKEEEKQ
jgi:hypothetical protein